MFLDDGAGGTVRAKANKEFVLFDSAARDTTHNSPDFNNSNHRGVRVTVDITAETPGGGTHTIVVKIQGKDPASGKYFDLLNSGNVTTVLGLTQLIVYPGVTVASGTAVSNVLPKMWRVRVEHTKSGASDMTYSAGVQLII